MSFKKGHVLSREVIERRAASMRRPIGIRFWRYVMPEPNSGCWLWTGCVSGAGYGRVAINRRATLATHVALSLHGRPRPFEGAFACHKCDVPSCVNPDHLFWGTPADNMRDKMAKGRGKTSGLVQNQKRPVTA